MNKTQFYEYPFKSNYLQIGNHNLHYIDEGQGPVMLLLHGNPTWSYYWRNIISYFKKSYRVIALDHMGMGLSSKPQDYSYTLEQHIDNTKALIKFLNLKDITLGVHDWGGAIGFGVVTQNPELFSKIFVFNTAAFLSKNIPKRISLCRNKYFGEWIVRKLNAFAYPATFMASSKKLDSKIRESYLFPYQNWNDRIAISRFVQDIPLERDHISYKTLEMIDQNLDKVQVPICIIWGGKDFCFDKTFFEEWIKRFKDAEAHWLCDANHYVIEDRHQDVVQIMENFLA